MAYLRRLIHRATVARPTVARTSTGVRAATLANVATAVPCLLQQGEQKRLLELFGADVQAEGMVFFAAGADVRPNATTSDGKSDHLTITNGGAALGVWQVVATKNPAAGDKMLVAAVKRVP